MSINLTKSQFQANKIGWTKSFLEGFSQDHNSQAVPWMTYGAIDFLQNYLKKDHLIFEYGCGASTLFFSQIAKVISIETNPRWLEIINGKMTSKNKENSNITLMTDGIDNENYQNFAADCAKQNNRKFDLIIIDSIKRFLCAKNAISALKDDGVIILDDSERKNYRKIFDFFTKENFKTKNFEGIAPGQLRIKNTSFFSKKFN